MTTSTMTRQDAATLIAAQVTTATRQDGTTYTTAADDSDARQLVRDVHFNVFDGMLPNDWVYENTRAIVNLFTEDDDPDAYELADDYTTDLYAWLTDNLLFAGFVNVAMADYHYESIDTAIQSGQQNALGEMADCIGAWLDAYADTRS
jgi:hypothetical protein